MTNASLSFDDRAREHPGRVALWLPHRGRLTFAELDVLARRAAAALIRTKIQSGDKILLFVDLGFELYAWIIAAARLGVPVLLVEPWMPLSRIERIVSSQRPHVFVASRLGKLWGIRVRAIRQIPHHVAGSSIHAESSAPHGTEPVSPELPCIVTFTSGSTGEPKGIVRTHGYLRAQLDALNDALHFAEYQGSDLCIFANFALANLANGRPSLVIPSQWRSEHLAMLRDLPKDLAPETVTAGPAFMAKLLETGGPSSLRAIHVGGALTDNAFFDRIFARWPEAKVSHVYGSTEAEPVAHTDAREAVAKSRGLGFFQTVYLGQPWERLKARIQGDETWIQGPHVAPEYLDNPEANSAFKKRDASGLLWHRMGDRIVEQDGGWYFAGRERQNLKDFEMEQRLYEVLGHSQAFIMRDKDQSLDVYVDPRGENPKQLVRATFSLVRHVMATKIVRDRRHRARIDRDRSMKQAKQL
jgi:acyl-CoA synthetase (AMP-forming)/AMP-acid ligase II